MKLNTKNNKKQIAPLPQENTTKVMDPLEISKLTKEDADTTPKLPITNKNNSNATTKSSFYKNATEISQFLTEESRQKIADEDNVKYY